jgi:hypothetical protein
MVLYNVTVSVAHSLAEEWKQWMKEVHIPDVMATGCFTGYRFMRLIGNEQDANGLSFAVQYETDSLRTLQAYFAKYANGLRDKVSEKYGDNILTFRSILEEVV